MSSNESRSPASPEPEVVTSPRTHAVRASWPTIILLPIFLGMLLAAAAAPYVSMFLGPQFGLSNGREAPWPWALVGVVAIGMWLASAIEHGKLGVTVQSIVLFVAGIVVVLGWFAIDPNWDVMPLVRRPWTLVTDNGHFFMPVFLGLVAWVVALRWVFDRTGESAVSTRERVSHTWIVLIVGVVMAAMIGDDIGEAGMRTVFVAIPVAIIGSIGAMGVTEMRSTRSAAIMRGTAAPGWDRWARIFAGTTVALLLITLVGALLLGPDFVRLVLDGVKVLWNAIATVLLWIVYAIIWVFAQIYNFLARFLSGLFGEVTIPEIPMEEGTPEGTPTPMEPGEPAEFPWATQARWAGVGLALLVLFLAIMSARRFMQKDPEGEITEERTRIFSTDLARRQLRNLFRRGDREERARKLNLDDEPGSVRETMLFLQVLAARQYVPRASSETARDFTARLSSAWLGLEAPFADLADLYERTRYGETDADREQAVAAWRTIYAARRDVHVPPPAPPDEDESEVTAREEERVRQREVHRDIRARRNLAKSREWFDGR